MFLNSKWDNFIGKKGIRSFFNFKNKYDNITLKNIKAFNKSHLQIEKNNEENLLANPLPLPYPVTSNYAFLLMNIFKLVLFIISLSLFICVVNIIGLYRFIFFEVLYAILVYYFISSFMHNIKWKNINLNFIVFFIVISSFFLNIFFQYIIVTWKNGILESLSFNMFLQYRTFIGEELYGYNVRSLSYNIYLLIQLIFYWFFSYAFMIKYILIKNINLVPDQVLEYSLLLKKLGYSKKEIETELFQKGWQSIDDQCSAFKAVSAFEKYYTLKLYKL